MIRLLAVPLSVAAVTLPMVTGLLPGTRVTPSPAARAAGAVEVHQVAVTGSGSRRVALLVGRTADNRLCVGSGSFFRCLTKEDSQPAYMLAAYGGTGSRREWGTVVGLLGPEIARVEIGRQDNGNEAVQHAQGWSGFPWRAVTVPPSGPNGRLPGIVNLVARGGSLKVFVDMFGVASSCMSRPACAHAGHHWRAVGDSPMAPVGLRGPKLRAARHLALSSALVRRVLGDSTRIVEVAPWTSCGGTFLGAGIHIMLFRPLSVKGDFPFVSFGKEKRGRAYAEGVMHYDLGGIDQLNVSVDLTRGKVVAVQPTGTDVTTREFHLVSGPTPAGPPDSASCPKGD